MIVSRNLWKEIQLGLHPDLSKIMYSYSFFLTLLLALNIPKEAKTQEWNTNNVAETLKDWLHNVENVRGETDR